MYAQGTTLSPREELFFQVNGKRRLLKFRPGDQLWVANTEVNQAATQTVEVCRRSQVMGTGYRFAIGDVARLFMAI